MEKANIMQEESVSLVMLTFLFLLSVPGRTVTFSTQFEREILRDLVGKCLQKRAQIECSSETIVAANDTVNPEIQIF